MRYDDFLAAVRDRGEYRDQQDAERVSRAVLGALGERLGGGEPEDLTAQLPDELSDVLLVQPRRGESVGAEEFLQRVGDQLDEAAPEPARWDSSAVLSTVAESIEGGELNHLLSQLPSGYATLFGHPELA